VYTHCLYTHCLYNKQETAKILLKSGGALYRWDVMLTKIIRVRRIQAGTRVFNPLKPELNPICYLLALLGAHHFLHVSRIRVKLLTFRLLMS